MKAPPFDVTGLPIRLTTTEVAELLRVSVATVLRRRRDGTLGIDPVDRGRQLLFAQADVLRLLDLTREAAQSAPSEKSRVSVEAIRRRQQASRERVGRKKPREPR